MATATLQWSDVARNPKKVAATVERDGQARLERRGEGSAFVLMTAERQSAARAGLQVIERLLRSALAAVKERNELDPVLMASFPWLRFIPAEHRSTFATEFQSTFEACAEIEVWEPLEQLLREWKATAAIYADPALLAQLKGPFDVDSGPVPRPEH
jgi:hypothetical protein